MATIDQLLHEAESTPIAGWDFSRLGDRIRTKPPPWDFKQIVEQHARRARDLLDMGTGGGEWLASLAYRPPRTVATEACPPNVDVASATLRPLDIAVVSVEAAPDNAEQQPTETRGRLPFPSESFELITNRHESFLATEVARVLVSGGVFLTQQTGGDYDAFYGSLGLTPPTRENPRWTLTLATTQVSTAGLTVNESDEGFEEVTFADAGALAWYLRAVPWVIEGFSVDKHRPNLERLQRHIDSEGSLSLRQPSFWLKATKPEVNPAPEHAPPYFVSIDTVRIVSD